MFETNISHEAYEQWIWLLNQINTVAYAIAVSLSAYSYLLSRNKRRRRNVFIVTTTIFTVAILVRISLSFNFDNYLARLVVAIFQTFFNYSMVYIFFRGASYLRRESMKPSATLEALDGVEEVFQCIIRPMINDEKVKRSEILNYKNNLNYKTQS